MNEKRRNTTEKRESNSTVFYEQLESEYNELLKKYAEAENTIDELRTGAKIRLYSDAQDIQPQSFKISGNKRRLQVINISPPLKALYTDENRAENANVLSFDDKVKTLKENVQSLEDCLCEDDIGKANLEEIFNLTTELSDDLKTLNSELVLNSSKPSEKGGIQFNRNEMKKELHRIKLRLDELQQDANTKLKSYNPASFRAKSNRGNILPQESMVCQPDNEESLIKADLDNLLKKLKDLKSDEKSLEHSKQYDSPTQDIYNDEAQYLSADSQDFVDGRYLTPSPDYLQHHRKETVSDDYTDDEEHLFQQPSREKEHRLSPSHGTNHVYHSHRTIPMTSYDESDNWLRQQPSSQTSDKNTEKQTKTNNAKYEPRRLSTTSSFGDNTSRVSTPLYPLRGLHDIARDNPRRSSNHNEHNSGISPREYECRIEGRGSKPMMQADNASTDATKHMSTRDRRRVSPRVDPRVEHHEDEVKKYQQTSTSNGIDSGFFGSEESRSSRLITESPTIMQKLNLSNPYDSSLRLDLSGINESEAEIPTDKTPYRRCSTERSETFESTLVDTSPSPLPSPSINLKRFAYNTTYPPRRSRELIPDSREARPSSSQSSKRRSRERGSPAKGTRGVTRDHYPTENERRRKGLLEDNRRNTLSGNWKQPEVDENSSNDKSRETPIRRRSLQDLRVDVNTLRDQIETILDQSRASQSFHDDARYEDEQWRHSFEKRNDQRFDDLTHNIEELKNEIFAKRRTDHRPNYSWKTSIDLRNQINEISQKLQELSKLRENIRAQDTSPSVSGRSDYVTDHFTELELQLNELKQQVTELKTDTKPVKYDVTTCPRCDDVTGHHHSYHKHVVSEPRSRIVTHVHYESPRQSPNDKLSNLRNLSLSYPGANVQSPVIHHVHTYPITSKVGYHVTDTDSSSDESDSKRRTRRFKTRRHSWQNRYRHRNDVVLRPEVINEARLATKDVQRLSKSILNKITLDLASFNE